MSRNKGFESSTLVVDLGKDRHKVVPIAQDIAIHRARVVTEAVMHMAAIRSLCSNESERTAQVQCVKAHAQTASAQFKQQAAHLLPGQIVVNGLPVWERATTTRAELRGEVELLKQQTMQCFAWTNVLPAEFNNADSAAEGRGKETPGEALKPLFGAVIRDLWRSARVDKANPLVVDRSAVYAALERWFSEISRIYLEASQRKTERGYDEVSLILATYANSFGVVNVGRFIQQHAQQLYQRYRWLY